MIYSEKGASDSISMTIEARRIRCLVRAKEIKEDLNDERMQGVGWLQAAVLLHNAVVVSILTYAAAAFIGMNNQQENSMESIQRKALIEILDISKTVTHKSLLFILGILPIKDVVKKLKICFINKLFHIKESGQCLETIKKDHIIGDIEGILTEVQQYCQEYKLPNVTEVYVDPEVIKDKIKKIAIDNLWLQHIKAKKPPKSIRRANLKPKFYASLPKNKAKLMLCYELGELNLRQSRKAEAIKKYGSTECLVPFCKEEDSWEHIQECPGYTSRLPNGWGPYQLIDYLVSLESERNRTFNKSLINFRSF